MRSNRTMCSWVTTITGLVTITLVNAQVLTNSATMFDNKQVLSSSNDINTVTYQKCKDMVAIIKAEFDGNVYNGTGFLCSMDGKKYLVTNRHVVNVPKNVQVCFQDGRMFALPNNTPVEVALNRDLVRFEIPTATKCLETVSDVPNIGESVEFYGNAGGQSVITVTSGKIMAIGLERIEIDASIQSGNSGSPLIRVRDGKVLGVTTISTFNKMDDPSKKGTRYDPKIRATREFAVRFTSVKWIPMKYGSFLHKVAVRTDIETFLKTVNSICGGKQELLLDNQLRSIKFSVGQQFRNLLRDVSRQDMKLRQAREKMMLMERRNKEGGSGRINSYGISDLENGKKRVKEEWTACFKVRLKMLQRLSPLSRQLNLFEEDRSSILKLAEDLVHRYEKENSVHLKGVDNSNVKVSDSSAPLIGERVSLDPDEILYIQSNDPFNLYNRPPVYIRQF